jgi:hypothetical protein
MSEFSAAKSGKNYYYPFYARGSYSKLFGFGGEYDQRLLSSLKLLTLQELKNALRIRDFKLIFPPFKIAKFNQFYVSPHELIVDLKKIEPGVYRIIVVHNFQIEDCNPNLCECTAGIFLSSQYEGRWIEPEDLPTECRTIEPLAYIDILKGHILEQ